MKIKEGTFMAITLRKAIITTGSNYDIPIMIKTKKGFDAIESAELSEDGTFIILNTYDFNKEKESLNK